MKKELNTLPKPFIAPGSDVKPTKEELKKLMVEKPSNLKKTILLSLFPLTE